MISQLNITESVIDRLRSLRGVILDVDGVMTSGDISYDSFGNELKTFHAHDGYGIQALVRAGICVAIMSGRHSAAVELRAKELGVTDVYQGLKDKSAALTEFTQIRGLAYTELAHIGDDIPDLVLFEHVGLAVAVANAVSKLKQTADLVLTRSGGDGAVREFADLLLSVQQK